MSTADITMPIQVPGTRLLTLASVLFSAPQLQTSFAIRPRFVCKANRVSGRSSTRDSGLSPYARALVA